MESISEPVAMHYGEDIDHRPWENGLVDDTQVGDDEISVIHKLQMKKVEDSNKVTNEKNKISVPCTFYSIVTKYDHDPRLELIENIDPVEVGELIDALCKEYDCSK